MNEKKWEFNWPEFEIPAWHFVYLVLDTKWYVFVFFFFILSWTWFYAHLTMSISIWCGATPRSVFGVKSHISYLISVHAMRIYICICESALFMYFAGNFNAMLIGLCLLSAVVPALQTNRQNKQINDNFNMLIPNDKANSPLVYSWSCCCHLRRRCRWGPINDHINTTHKWRFQWEMLYIHSHSLMHSIYICWWQCSVVRVCLLPNQNIHKFKFDNKNRTERAQPL